MQTDQTTELRERLLAAASSGDPLLIQGSGSKAFLGRTTSGKPLDVTGHRGILNYQPKELVVTARCGTPLTEIEEALTAEGQLLPFEPPHFGPGATIGGAIATGLSGPARPYAGAARDLVLGTRILTGKGQVLRFGGEVMKNVAGYDVSRLMTGAMGTLGVLLDVSVKVMPRPAAQRTLVQESSTARAIEQMNAWAGKPLPITATCFDGERLHVRLAGTETAVTRFASQIGGEPADDAEDLWDGDLREQQHAFFAGDTPLWRLSVPQPTPPIDLPGQQLIEWGGAQRWLRSDAPAESIREAVAPIGGHATLFRGGDHAAQVFHPLPPALLSLHQRLKQAFDPEALLNPGRLYAEL